MIDVVANHMGYPQGCDWHPCERQKLLNVSGLFPFSELAHYHELCEIKNWRNQTQVEFCRLANLPDLNQTVPFVRQALLEWISNMTSGYNVDGYRIDTVVEVSKDFWPAFQNASGVFCLGEANNGDNTEYIAGYQGPLVSVLNFPMYWALRRAFIERKSMAELTNSLKEQRQYFSDVTVLGLFVDNHDFNRFLNLSYDTALLKNALMYVMMGEGIPILYYGTEQSFHGGGDPLNRESLWPYYNTSSDIYRFISSTLSIRRSAGVDFTSRNQRELYVDANTLVFSRGKQQEVLVILTNKGSSDSSRTKVFRGLSGYKDGTVFQNVMDHTDMPRLTSGQLNVILSNGQPRVYKVKTRGDVAGGADSVTASLVSVMCVLSLVFPFVDKHTS